VLSTSDMSWGIMLYRACQRRFQEVVNTSPEPGGMTSVIASGCSALSKISSQRAYGSRLRSASSTA
jgi:hypothetical protein